MADLVQVAVNLVLIVGVIRLADGGSVRCAGRRELLRSTGPAYLGYGVVAFLMVVLWEPAGVGPFSVVLVLAPLFVARWAYAQYAEEAQAHEQTLDVLVAAVEAKAPHLAGHSAASPTSASTWPSTSACAVRRSPTPGWPAMLHDLGQTTLPTGLVRGASAPGGTAPSRTYPARGVEVLRGHQLPVGVPRRRSRHTVRCCGAVGARGLDPPLVVGLADEFDLLTEVGTPDGVVLARRGARPLRANPGAAGRRRHWPRARPARRGDRGAAVRRAVPAPRAPRAWFVLAVGASCSSTPCGWPASTSAAHRRPRGDDPRLRPRHRGWRARPAADAERP